MRHLPALVLLTALAGGLVAAESEVPTIHEYVDADIDTLDPARADDTYAHRAVSQVYETLYEYHYLDETEDPPQFVSQIPEGFAGPQSEIDAYRADASPWLERLPVVRGHVRGRGAWRASSRSASAA